MIPLRDVLGFLRTKIKDQVPHQLADQSPSATRTAYCCFQDVHLIDALNTAQNSEILEHPAEFTAQFIFHLINGVRSYTMPPGCLKILGLRRTPESTDIPIVSIEQRPTAQIGEYAYFPDGYKVLHLYPVPTVDEDLTLVYLKAVGEFTLGSQEVRIQQPFLNVVIYRAALDLRSDHLDSGYVQGLQIKYNEEKAKWKNFGSSIQAPMRFVGPLEHRGTLNDMTGRKERM